MKYKVIALCLALIPCLNTSYVRADHGGFGAGFATGAITGGLIGSAASRNRVEYVEDTGTARQAYQDGYDDGYKAGYDAAMNKIRSEETPAERQARLGSR